jgi:hypothetical protein
MARRHARRRHRTRVSVELDHVFILCAADAPEAEALTRLGLREGSPNTHPGQGTACRRFFFDNAYIELLWVHDEQEVRSDQVARLRLWERWSQRGQGASPFGIVLRPAGGAPAAPPFRAWAYTPPYLPAGLAIDVAIDTPLSEPERFYVGFQRARPADTVQPYAHAIGAREITDVTIGTGHLMALTLDGGGKGMSADLRPDLPLTLRW